MMRYAVVAAAGALCMSVAVDAGTVSYAVQQAVPTAAASIDATPVAASFEFFLWPYYATSSTLADTCMKQLSRVYGRTTPIRIGGTTQDRGTFDPSLKDSNSCSVPGSLDAPMTLTYGPKFLDLIASYNADTTLGFNRGDNNRTNTFQAVLSAKSRAFKQLASIELGNEPDLYLAIWQKPVAVASPPWNETQEGADAADWAQDFLKVWKDPAPKLSGGVYAVPIPFGPSLPNLPYLITTAYNASVKAGTKQYCEHLYSLTNATASVDMNHASTVSDLNYIAPHVQLATQNGRPYVIGETGFHAFDEDIDKQFGGALQVLDKALRAISIGVQRLYYHQGTINQATFNWWTSTQVEMPFYGAFMAALAMKGGDRIVASDAGTDSYAQYVIYQGDVASRIVLINTDWFNGTGTSARNQTTFAVSGLKARASLKSIRMTASSSIVSASDAAADPARAATIAGQTFSNKDCSVNGAPRFESTTVSTTGQVNFVLRASEALLIQL